MAMLALHLIHHRPDRDPNSEQHLKELHECDVDCESHERLSKASAHASEVPIHDEVDYIVHDSEPNARGNLDSIAVPTVQERCCVMPPMQTNSGLCTQHKQHVVYEFGELRQDEEQHEDTTGSNLVPLGRRADGKVEAIRTQGCQKQRSASEHAGKGEHREGHIPPECETSHLHFPSARNPMLQNWQSGHIHSNCNQWDLPMQPERPGVVRERPEDWSLPLVLATPQRHSFEGGHALLTLRRHEAEVLQDRLRIRQPRPNGHHFKSTNSKAVTDSELSCVKEGPT
mmetsp:Transcript_52894/g.170718  ORF Transcript_52894/g.170718 Transcript_52894/m.170718 type:complete len:285 (+) Transcript_52894:727-1581(+)